MKKKILIIGGTGFIGRNLIKRLRSIKFNVISISKKKLLPKSTKNIVYKSVDITNKKKLKKLSQIEFDVIINLGGNINHQNPKETFQAHFFGLKNILNTQNLEKLSLFIQIGSSLEYGTSRSPHKETQFCKPNSSYGKAKLKATNYLIRTCNLKNIKFIILRPYQIFGPFQKLDRLIPQVVKYCLNGMKFNCTEGNQKRDFLFVEDFINLILKILNKKKFRLEFIMLDLANQLKLKKL